MWVYEILPHRIWQRGEGRPCLLDSTACYAGRGAGLNNPSWMPVKATGPLPVGFYTISDPADYADVGEFALRLVPDALNEMFNRRSFFAHGDDKNHAGLQIASHGCIVTLFGNRKIIADSGDRRLQVITGLPGRCL